MGEGDLAPFPGEFSLICLGEEFLLRTAALAAGALCKSVLAKNSFH